MVLLTKLHFRQGMGGNGYSCFKLPLAWLEDRAWSYLKACSLISLVGMLLWVGTFAGYQNTYMWSLHVTWASSQHLPWGLGVNILRKKAGGTLMTLPWKCAALLPPYPICSHKSQLNLKGRESRLYPLMKSGTWDHKYCCALFF